MKISIFFLLGVAFILMTSIQDCNGHSGPAKRTRPSSDDSADLPVEPKKSRRTRPKSMTTDADAANKVKSNNPRHKTRKATGADAIPHSRRPRAIAAEQPELMYMAAEEGIGMFLPGLLKAITNFFKSFTSKPSITKLTTPESTTTTEEPKPEIDAEATEPPTDPQSESPPTSETPTEAQSEPSTEATESIAEVMGEATESIAEVMGEATESIAEVQIDTTESPEQQSESPAAESATPDTPPEESSGPFVCPKSNGLFPNPTNCNTFYSCGNGKAYLMDCPAGLKFNTATSNCDWPANVNCPSSD